MKKRSLYLFSLSVAFIYFSECKTKKQTAETKPVPVAIVEVKTVAPTPTYNAEIKNILDKECSGCHHSEAGPILFNPERIELDSYEGTKAIAIYKKFLGALNHEPAFLPMPKDHAKLDDKVIQKITLWVQNGMPR